MFDRNRPFNDLPPLPPPAEVETAAVLKKAITASRALAELKGMAERMPNQAMLIDSLVLQEARASSEIENILTTNDELFKAASDEALPASAEAREVLRYRQALNYGFRQIRERPLATGLFIEIAQLIKQTDVSVRRTPGTRITNGRGETIRRPKAKRSSATSCVTLRTSCTPRMGREAGREAGREGGREAGWTCW